MNRDKEQRRREKENLGLNGRWTYHFRSELKAAGCLWNGRAWLAPSPEEHARLTAEFSAREIVEPWSVTVHGDGGWKDGIGRWAWFCRSSLPPKLLEGCEEGACQDAFATEAFALHKGVLVSIEAWTPQPGGTLYLRSDNKGVIDAVVMGRSRRSEAQGLIGSLDSLRKHVRIDAKHVHGHQDSRNSIAAWVNNRVDKASSMRGR